MRPWKPISISIVLLVLGLALAGGTGRSQPPSPPRFAVADLRAMGPAGLQALLDRAQADPALGRTPEYQTALDAVCAQHDCAASHLYWYTDLDAAREEARRTGKPILSLRLLGRLDEELSCANSRFFRMVLYPDPRISRLLRDRFVLHWASVRPVPHVTIDFGDGRRLAGTVTGNSIHYVLDAHGRLVDALPGLNGPGAFLRFLQGAQAEAERMAGLSDELYAGELEAFHGARLARRYEAPAQEPRIETAVWMGPGYPAIAASRISVSKMAVEAPVLTAVAPGMGSFAPPRIVLSDAARRSLDDAALSEPSRRLLLAKARAWMKIDDEDAAVARFEAMIAEDTVRNESQRHPVLHDWLMKSRGVPDLAAFNERVYSELFLTPSSDPWLGLGPQEAWAVITPER
jgi:hypothetical protein